MTVITRCETFEDVPDGAAISTGTTDFDEVNGDPAALTGTADALNGNGNGLVAPRSLRVDAAVFGNAIWQTWPGFARVYVRIDALPTGDVVFLTTRVGGVTKTELQLEGSSRRLRIRDQFVQEAISDHVFAAGDALRAELHVTATGQECRLFIGVDGNRDTPTEILTGDAENTPGVPDTVWLGAGTAGGGVLTMDNAALGTDWIGRARWVAPAGPDLPVTTAVAGPKPVSMAVAGPKPTSTAVGDLGQPC